jgi:hypothetical protein
VYGIVQSLGGQIDVLSRTVGDTGTEFRIFLPLAGRTSSASDSGVKPAAKASNNDPNTALNAPMADAGA